MWAQICADIENHQSAWEKITQGKFYLSTYKDPKITGTDTEPLFTERLLLRLNANVVTAER